MKYSIISHSTYDAISFDSIKSQIRMSYGDVSEDDFFKRARNAAVDLTENYLNRFISKKTIKLYIDDFPYGDEIELPFAPIIKVPSSGIVYTNSTGNSTTFGSTKWSQDIISEPGRIVLTYGDDWPTGITLAQNNPVSIEYQCGYGSTILGSIGSTNKRVPDGIMFGLTMIIASWYEHREDFIMSDFGNEFLKMPIGSEKLMYHHRLKGF